MGLSSAYLGNKFALSSSTMTLDRCSLVNKPWHTGQYSLCLLKICGGSSLLSINDRWICLCMAAHQVSTLKDNDFTQVDVVHFHPNSDPLRPVRR